MIAQAQFTIADLSDTGIEVVVGTQTASTNAWRGNASFSELRDGQTILYWLPFAGNGSAVTLNLTLADGTETGAVNVYINTTTQCSSQIPAGNVALMTYRKNTLISGTGLYTGWWISRSQDTTTNYYDRINYKASVTATGSIFPGQLGVFNSQGKLIKLSTTSFDVTKPILYVGTSYSSSSPTQTNNYISWGTPFALTSTVTGFSGTAGAAVYIKGTLTGTMLRPASGVLTTTVPKTEDGYTYMLLGLMSTSTHAVLAPEHPMYRYYKGGFKTISQISFEAFTAAQAAQTAINNLELGGRNYALASGTEQGGTEELIARYALSEPMEEGQEYTVSFSIAMEDLAQCTVRTSGGEKILATLSLDDVPKVLMTAGDMTMTVVVTDSRGRTASYSTTFFVMDYNSPSIRQFKAERCNSDGTEAKVDGTNVRYSLQSSVTPLDNQNALSCVVYYKLNTATAWSVAETLPVTSYNLSAVDKLLEQTFDDLASYDLKVRLTDYFYYAEQAISIGTKGVIMDILSDGTGIAFGKVAEESEHVEFGWPLSLSEPLAISEGGTGADTAVGACNAIGAVKKAGDAMTGNLTIFGQLYPSLLLQPYNNDTTNRTVFEGSYVGASSFASWEDGTGNNRRMLEVRTKAYASALDNAVLLRTAENGNWNQYRVFHAGMESGVPIANGGTGATTAVNARTNLGTNNASNLTTGTVNAARLPFKVQYGQTTITGVSWTTVSLSGFTSTPTVIVSYAGNPSSSGISVLKTGNESASSFQVCMAGSSGSGSRKVNWIAIGK